MILLVVRSGAPSAADTLGECGLEPFDRRGLHLVPATGGRAHGFGKLYHERAIALKLVGRLRAKRLDPTA